MSIKSLPEHGLELSLDEYTKLRAFQGGGWYWDHHHQQTIRECLGEFLPRVEETGAGDRGGALFQHFVGGKEAAARSQPVAAGGDRVPAGELRRLQNALENLKRKAAAPETDRDARRIIESFALPDPSKDPELYRLYGPPWRRRLLVLWGCEREPGTSVAPFAALNRMPVEPPSTTWLRRWPLLLGALLLLLLLILLAFLLWPRRRDPAAPSTNVPASIGAPGAAVPGSPPPASPGAATAADLAANLSSAPSAGPLVPLPTVDPVTGEGPSGHARSAAPDSASGGIPPVVPGPGKEAAAHAAPPGTEPTASRPNAAAPSSGSPQPSAPRGVSPPAGKTDRSGPTNDASHTPPGQSPPAGNPGTFPPNPAGTANASLMKIKVTAGYADAPRNGKVDVSLTATAEGADFQVQSLTVTEWRVDGSVPADLPRPISGGSQLKLSMPEGIHRVRVTGAASGTVLTTEVEMDVHIRSQSEVKVKPGVSP